MGIILFLSFIGELLNTTIPLPIPASIYGLILMFTGLKLQIIPPDAVKETGSFLIEIMPLMFIPAAVGLLDAWNMIQAGWFSMITITVVSTIAVMSVSGYVTQSIIRLENRRKTNA